MPTSYEMINTQGAINLFKSLMQPHSQIRVLRLEGEAKMGKSHLLTKVFPILTRQDYQARYAVVDIRNPTQSITDFLHVACRQLGAQACNDYLSAYHASISRPIVEVKDLLARFSLIKIFARNSLDNDRQMERHLTTQFVNDLNRLDDKLLLLLFDSVDNATKSVQTWLMDMLLPQLSPLNHVRIVVAGRSLPEAYGSYGAFCQSYRLLPVTEVQAYIAFCQTVNATLAEQSIHDFARAFGYKPGIFVDYVLPTFVLQRVSSD